MKDLLVSLLMGMVVGLVLLIWQASDPILVGVVTATLVGVLRLGAAIRHLTTGAERDVVEIEKVRIETEKLKEELRRLQSSIHQADEAHIEIYCKEPFVKSLEDRGETPLRRFRKREGK